LYTSRLERGACNPTLASIEKVARGLNMTLAEFFTAMERLGKP
jgi:transcriptional regulator with XRE-family HTH domain